MLVVKGMNTSLEVFNRINVEFRRSEWSTHSGFRQPGHIGELAVMSLLLILRLRSTPSKQGYTDGDGNKTEFSEHSALSPLENVSV